MKKFLVIDGNSLIHRAFYALPLLQNKDGAYTNAVYGFTKMFLKILNEQEPDYVAVCFDKGKITFRHERFEQYKGTRKATPHELRPQFEWVRKVLTALGVSMYELENYEADDLIGKVAQAADEHDIKTLIVTGDRDALQLVSDKTEVLLTRKGISELERYDLAAVKERYGLTPRQLIDVKGLMGDQSDNIPGVPGVGEKTAVKLINQFGCLEEVLANIDQVSGKKLKERLQEHSEQAMMSKELATIHKDVPVQFDIDSCCNQQQPDYTQVLKIFKELEFTSLVGEILNKMDSADGKQTEQLFAGEVKEVVDADAFAAALKEIDIAGPVAFYLNRSKDSGWGIGISDGETAIAGTLSNNVYPLVNEFMHNCPALITHNAKIAHRLFDLGLEIKEDTLLAGYLLNPSLSSHELPQLAVEHLGVALTGEAAAYWGRGAAVIAKLMPTLLEKLAADDMEGLYRQLELPLERVLAAMEVAGIKVDHRELEQMGGMLRQGIERLTAEIYQMAGREFNINSPKQLGVVLFEDLGLPPLKKTKTGYSTSAQVLEELAPKHDIVAKILEYRTLVKLKSTYVEGLVPLINPDTGKIHTTFNQTITSTGRLSSTEPNLQNIPVRLELGRKIRRAFVPSSKEQVLLAADYSQIELRVLAHISGDTTLKEAFHHGQDIHTRTAAEVFGVAMDEVTGDMRRSAKAVNFGIVYGISDYGLARDLGISRKRAGEYIQRYFERYHGVKAWIDKVIFQAREAGFVTTLLNRRRYLPDLVSSNWNVRKFGERTAMNTPIQGSAADIIKLAMLAVDEYLGQVPEATMLLQVHDELILEVQDNCLDNVSRQVKQRMEQAYQLDVPLVADFKKGPDWYRLEPFNID